MFCAYLIFIVSIRRLPLVYTNSIHDKHRFYRHNTYVDVRVGY